MADLFCSLPLFLPPKRYSSSVPHSHNSRISRIKRRPPHLPLLFKPSPFVATASDIDVISTHEHSDGSFLFRFGDPSEVVKNVEMEEANIAREEMEGEDTNGSSMVEVVEGEDESEITTAGLTEVTVCSDSTVSSSNTLVAVEGESGFSEKLLVAPIETELPVLTSNQEIGGISSSDLDVEPIGLNEESLEEAPEVTCTSKEVAITSIHGVEECLNEEDVDSPADASILDQSSEVVDNVTAVALLVKESDDISSADSDADESGKVEEGVDGDYEDSPVDAYEVDKSSEVGGRISAVVLLEKEANCSTVTSDIEIEPIGNVEAGINEVFEESPLDIASVVDNTTAALSEKQTADVTSAPDIDIECTGNVEQGVDEVLEEPSAVEKRPQVENRILAQELLEKETADMTSAPDIDVQYTGNVEQGLDEVLDEPSLVEKRPEVENLITAQELSEKETAEITSSPDIDIQYTGNVEEGLDEVLDEPCLVEKSPEVENRITAQELSEEETADITSSPDIDIVYTGNVERGPDEVLEEPSLVEKRPEVENSITAQELSEEETAEITSSPDIDIVYTGNVERDPDEGLEEPSLVEKRPEVENCITAQELSEKETADITSAPDIDVEYTSNVEQGLDEVPSLVERRPTAQELLEKETADATTSVALKTNPVVSMLDTDAGQGRLETAVTPNAVPISELQNAETVIHDETIGDGRESFDDTLVSPSSHSEPPMSLYKETEAPNLQAEVQKATEESTEVDVNNIEAIEMQNVLTNDKESDLYVADDETASGFRNGMLNKAVGYVSEKDDIQLLTVSPQLEADSILEEETGTGTVEELKEDNESKNQTVGDDFAEASVHEVTAPESAESTITRQEILMTDFILSSGAALLPHPSKVLTGGEDAYFIADETWLGVADGVSQWSLEGTSLGVYAHELIKNCEKLISECIGNSINNPIELLNLSVTQTHSPGSSTVLIARFDGQALHVANIGDSGFIILRHGAVYKRSSPMHHVFSLPVQIERGEDPSSLAQLYKVDLEEEDIIVTATDGLLDNLYDQEISLIATKSLANDKTPKEIAESLAKKAQDVGSSASARSPFADDAQAAGFPGYTGGKLDDVAVIVSFVQRR